MALSGDCQAKNYAYELEDALKTLSTFDEGPTLCSITNTCCFSREMLTINTTSMPLMNLAQARKILRRASWLCLNGGGIDGQENNILGIVFKS